MCLASNPGDLPADHPDGAVLFCAQHLGACTNQEPYSLVTELMSGSTLESNYAMIQVRGHVHDDVQ